MKKIAVICSDGAKMFHPLQGAVSTVAINLNQRLADRYEIRTFFGGEMGGVRNDTYHQISVNNSDKLKNLPFFLQEPAVPYLKKVAGFLNEWQPGLVQIHNRPHFILWLKRFLHYTPRFILHEHNHQIRDCFSPAKARKILEAADTIVGVSQFVVDYTVKEPYPEFANKCIAVTNGIDTGQFRPAASLTGKQELRQQLGIPLNKTVILYSGAIRPRKGVHTLLAAFLELRKTRQDICLVLVGANEVNNKREDYYFETIKKQAAHDSSHIVLTGFVDTFQMPQLYQTADIFCAVPDWDEPLGLVFLEAQASGLPVVSCRKGGIPEVVKDKESGFILSSPVPNEGLVSVLNRLIDDQTLRNTMGQQARMYVMSNWTWNTAVEKMETVYTSLA